MSMPRIYKAHVRNGRLLLDEPTDLPEGTEVDLVPLDAELGRRHFASADLKAPAGELDPNIPKDPTRGGA